MLAVHTEPRVEALVEVDAGEAAHVAAGDVGAHFGELALREVPEVAEVGLVEPERVDVLHRGVDARVVDARRPPSPSPRGTPPRALGWPA